MVKRIRIIEIILLFLLVLGFYINFFTKGEYRPEKDYTNELEELKTILKSNNVIINKLDNDIKKNSVIVRSASKTQRDSLRSIYNPK